MVEDTSVLVVDDQKEITMAIRRLLSRKYNVVEANTAAEVKIKLLEQEYAVIILDFDLQDEIEDGITLSNLANKLHPFSQTILLTGNLEYDTIKRALNEGSIAYFINKPIVAKELMEKVEEAGNEYHERIKVTNILKNPNDMSKIKHFMTDVFKPVHIEEIKLLGVFIAVDSIPVLSTVNHDFLVRSEDSQINEDDYGILFSSFLSALVTLGLEAISAKDGSHLNGFKLQNYQFMFRFSQNIQYTYLFYSPGEMDMNAMNIMLISIHEWIERKIEQLKPTRYKFLDDPDLNDFIASYFQ